MRFGTSTMFLRERPVSSALEAIAGAGFAGAEIWEEHFRSRDEAPAPIGRLARRLGLALSVHAVTYDVNISSVNAGIGRESVRQMAATLRTAARLGAASVAMHPGHLSHKRDQVERVWAPLLETVAALDELAARLGVRLGIEGMEKRNLEYLVQPQDLARLFPQPWRATGLTVDLAHANTIMDPLAYLDAIAALPIVHAHCSDNAPDKTHLPLGQGSLDLVGALAALGRRYDGMVIIEGYVPGQGERIIAENAAWLRRHGFMA